MYVPSMYCTAKNLKSEEIFSTNENNYSKDKKTNKQISVRRKLLVFQGAKVVTLQYISLLFYHLLFTGDYLKLIKQQVNYGSTQ